MAIQPGHVSTLNTIKRAAAAGDLALAECSDAESGEKVITLCAIHVDQHGQYTVTPLAKLFDGNPYDELKPPSPWGISETK